MGSSDKFCLRWNDFEANISSAFKELRQERDFFDVTLTVDDDPSHVLQAHKVILSACSPFFRNMLLRPQTALGGAGLGHPHPLIYLRGVSFEDMRHILDFMYYGEVNVAQDDLEAFLQVAEDLKVKGLTQSDSAGPTPLAPIKHEAPVVPATASQSLKRDPPDRGANGATSQKRPRPSTAGPSTPTVPAHIASDEIQEIPGEAVKSEPGALNAADFEGGENYDGAEGLEGGEGDFEYGQYGDESGDMTYAEGDEGQLLPGTSAGGDESKEALIDSMVSSVPNGSGCVCLKCGYRQNRATVKRHIRSVHLGVKFSCHFCLKEFSREDVRKNHYDKEHNLVLAANQIREMFDPPTAEKP